MKIFKVLKPPTNYRKMLDARHGVHQVSNEGYLKEGDLYESRIDYPEALGHRILDIIKDCRNTTKDNNKKYDESSRILEIAAGTGKLTKLIRKVSLDRGERLDMQAIEPNAKLYGIFVKRFPDVPISMSSTETLARDLEPWLREGPVDAVLIGQAYHWFSSPKTLSLLSSVMKPGAPLILTWSVEDQTVPWVHRFKSIYEVFDYCIPSYRSRRWQSTFQDPSIANLVFRAPCTQEWFRTFHKSNLVDLIARVQSKSYIAVLTPAEKVEICDNVRRFIENDPEWNNMNDLKNKAAYVDMPFLTELYWTTKIN